MLLLILLFNNIIINVLHKLPLITYLPITTCHSNVGRHMLMLAYVYMPMYICPLPMYVQTMYSLLTGW